MPNKPSGTEMTPDVARLACFDADYAAAANINQADACQMHRANQAREKRKGKILAPSQAVNHKMKR